MPEDDRPTIDPERLYELRAALGPDVERVVHLANSKRYDLRTGHIHPPPDRDERSRKR